MIHKPSLQTVALLFLLMLAACAKEKPANVILISLDTLRPDRLGCYGYSKPTSPFLDRFASQGALFENAVAQSPWTLPSHASMFTGLFPHKAGMSDEWCMLPKEIPTLASLLREKGFHTAGFVNSYWITGESGLNRGFDLFRFFHEDDQPDAASEISNQAITWLKENKNKRFFLFLHYYLTHSDYSPDLAYHQPFVTPYDGIANGTTLQLKKFRKNEVTLTEKDIAHNSNLYDAEIRQLDDVLKDLMERIKNLGLDKNSLIIITADHGEEFFEHGGVLHGKTLYKELLQIPLIFSGPGIPKGLRVKTPAMLTDIFPTVLGSLGEETILPFDGINLLPKMNQNPATQRLLFANGDKKNQEDDIKRMVQSLKYKLCYNRLTKEKELYDLENDPQEKYNMAQQKPEIVNKMMQQIKRIMSDAREGDAASPRSAEQIKRLEELGY